MPWTNVWLGAMAQTRPCFFRTGQSLGSTISTLSQPSRLACWHICSRLQCLSKHHLTIDCLRRLFLMTGSAARAGLRPMPRAPAAASAAALCRTRRRVNDGEDCSLANMDRLLAFRHLIYLSVTGCRVSIGDLRYFGNEAAVSMTQWPIY